MDIIPTEIYMTILSYLDTKTTPFLLTGKTTKSQEISELETFKTIEAFPRELSQNNWAQLFILRYPEYLTQNLYQYNIRDVYLELLAMGSGNVLFLSRHKTAVRYLLLNGFIPYNKQIVAISKLDDPSLLGIFEEIPSSSLSQFIIDDSIKIVEEILSKGIQISTDNEELYDIFHGLYLDYDVSLEMTEVIFKYVEFPEEDLVGILLFGNLKPELNNFIFSKLKGTPDIVMLTDRLIDYSSTYDDYDKFIPIWNIYNKLLSKEDIIKIYKNFMYQTNYKLEDKQNKLYSIITEIAQHPVIKEKFLRR